MNKEWWVTLYGLYGSSFMRLKDVDKETMIQMITHQIDYKLESYSQEERNQLEFSGNE